MSKRLFVTLVILLLALPITYGLTAAMRNARMVLRPEVPEGEVVQIDKSIFVENVNNISIKVTLEPDKRYQKIIEVFDKEFILEPNESKEAAFRITLKSGGNYDGRILVSFTPADPNIEENPVGLSSRIIIIAEGPVNEYYDEVMSEQPAVEEEPVDIKPISFEEPEVIEEGGNVSVSLGSSRDIPVDSGSKVNPFVGILITLIIVIIGVGIFFAIRSKLK